AVRLRLLRQVVEDDQDVLALVHPVLPDRGPGVGGDVLEARGLRRGSRHDGGVLHRAGLLQGPPHVRDRGALLPHRDVDAADLLVRVAGLPVLLLVDDGVHADGRLARLPVTDDQLPLAPADRRHRVDGLDAGLQRLLDRLPLHDGGRLQLERAALGGLDRALAVQGVPQRVDDAAEIAVADRDREDLAGPAGRLALLDLAEVTQDDDADLAHVQVQSQATGPVLELDELVRHRGGKALDVGDAVARIDDGADLFARGGLRLVRLDEALQRVPDLVRT